MLGPQAAAKSLCRLPRPPAQFTGEPIVVPCQRAGKRAGRTPTCASTTAPVGVRPHVWVSVRPRVSPSSSTRVRDSHPSTDRSAALLRGATLETWRRIGVWPGSVTEIGSKVQPTLRRTWPMRTFADSGSLSVDDKRRHRASARRPRPDLSAHRQWPPPEPRTRVSTCAARNSLPGYDHAGPSSAGSRRGACVVGARHCVGVVQRFRECALGVRGAPTCRPRSPSASSSS